MLNKLIKVILLFVLVLGIGSYNADIAEASSSKVMWGKTELKVGQIGKVTILKDTELVAMDKEGRLHTIRTLSKGDEFRVYQYKGQHGGLYGVGDSSFVQKNDVKVKYETPSKSKLELVKTGGVEIPVVNGTDKVEKIFKDVLGESYTVKQFDTSVDSYKNNVREFTYDKTDINYFFILNTNNKSKAYKLMVKLGFPLSEKDFNAMVNTSDYKNDTIRKDNVEVFATKSRINITWE